MNNISAVFIGEGKVLLSSLEKFKELDGKIIAIITKDQVVLKWASINNVFVLEPNTSLKEFVRSLDFDYLFSINNNFSFLYNIIEYAKKAAINLHYGLLPKYAGSNTHIWSLLNGEREYGITWHYLNKKIEEERIVLQSIFAIREDERASSLISYCNQRAIETFTELLHNIKGDRIVETEQSLQEREFYSKYLKPLLAGIIDFNNSAESIEKAVRALNIQGYQNRVCLPKIKIEFEYFGVLEAVVEADASAKLPGTIVNINSGKIVVSTGTKNLSMSKLVKVEGAEVDITELAERYNLKRDYQLQYPSSTYLTNFMEYDYAVNKSEEYWVKVLEEIHPLEVSIRNDLSKNTYYIQNINLSLVPNVEEDYILLYFILFLYRKYNQTKFTIGLQDFKLEKYLNNKGAIFSDFIPLNVTIEPNEQVSELLMGIDKLLTAARLHKTFYKDIVLRYPELSHLKSNGLIKNVPILLAEVDSLSSFHEIEGSLITFIKIKNQFYLSCSNCLFDEKSMNQFASEFKNFVYNIYLRTNIKLNQYLTEEIKSSVKQVQSKY